MDNAERGREPGRPPRRSGPGEPPRGWARPRMVVIEPGSRLIPLEFQSGDDIVTGLYNYARYNRGLSLMEINNALGMVSEFTLQGQRTRHFGTFQIQSMRGRWVDFRNGRDDFTVTIGLRDVNNGTEIRGISSSVIAGSFLIVYVEI